MSEDNVVTADSDAEDNGVADSIAMLAVITVVIGTVVYWLSGMPS
jgi:hypothetical protein